MNIGSPDTQRTRHTLGAVWGGGGARFSETHGAWATEPPPPAVGTRPLSGPPPRVTQGDSLGIDPQAPLTPRSTPRRVTLLRQPSGNDPRHWALGVYAPEPKAGEQKSNGVPKRCPGGWRGRGHRLRHPAAREVIWGLKRGTKDTPMRMRRGTTLLLNGVKPSGISVSPGFRGRSSKWYRVAPHSFTSLALPFSALDTFMSMFNSSLVTSSCTMPM